MESPRAALCDDFIQSWLPLKLLTVAISLIRPVKMVSPF